MEIAIVLLEDFPGSDNRVQRQAKSLTSAGHHVTVYCASGPSQENRWNGVQVERSIVQRVKAGSMKVRLVEYIGFQRAAKRWLEQQGDRFDLVQVANPPDSLVFAATNWRRLGHDRRILFDVHDPMPELMLEKTGSRVGAYILRSLQGAACRASDAVIAAGRWSEVLQRDHGIEVVAIRNGVDLERFPVTRPEMREWPSDEVVHVVYAGTIARRFGVREAAEAVISLNDGGRTVILDIFGDGDDRSSLEVLAGAHPDCIVLHGQVPSTELADRILGSRVGLVPYRDSAFMRLAESTKAYEYAALGIPVVSSDLPTVRAQLGDDGAVWVRPGDCRALADGIRQVLQWPDEARHRALVAQKRAIESSWSMVEPEYVALVESLGRPC